jgi:RND family efflux transporter MFP subunit
MSVSVNHGSDRHARSRVRWLAALGARLGLALGILGAVGLGVAGLYARSGDVVGTLPPAVPVLALTVEEVPGHAELRSFAGRLEPARQTALGFERGGLLKEVLVEEGDRIEAGQLVARLDTAILANEEIRLTAARAQQLARLELARLTFDRQQNLSERARSAQRKDEARLAVTAAEAALAETDAALSGLAIDLAKSELRAPFAGEIATRHLDEGTVIAAGASDLALLEVDRPTARFGLAPEAAAALAKGEHYQLEHDGRTFSARLAALRPDLDPRARTVTALFDLEGDPDLPFGAVLKFSSEAWVPGAGFWVPVSSLVEGDRGLWSVLTLEDDASVGRELVSVVALRGDEAFVQGSLRTGDRIIPKGTHRVQPGQDVRVAQAE